MKQPKHLIKHLKTIIELKTRYEEDYNFFESIYPSFDASDTFDKSITGTGFKDLITGLDIYIDDLAITISTKIKEDIDIHNNSLKYWTLLRLKLLRYNIMQAIKSNDKTSK